MFTRQSLLCTYTAAIAIAAALLDACNAFSPLLPVPARLVQPLFKQKQLAHHRRLAVGRQTDRDTRALSSSSLSLSPPPQRVDCDCDEDQVTLSTSGQSMQILTCLPPMKPSSMEARPPEQRHLPVLLFLHGSFHGAWCWREHFMPYLSSGSGNNGSGNSVGYIAVAASWRGTGGSPVTTEGNAKKKIPIQDHVQDLTDLLNLLPSFLQDKLEQKRGHSASRWTVASTLPPVLISHSFGGLVVMKYLERYFDESRNNSSSSTSRPFSGIVSLCSVPPSGNGRMTLRYLRQRPLRTSWQITRGLALKQCCTDVSLCRTLFLDDTINEADILRYQTYFGRDSVVTIDLIDLAKQLPSARTDPKTGQALFLVENTSPLSTVPPTPCLVVGATRDFIVDREGVEETARYYFGASLESHLVWVDSPHDVMLSSQWQHTADVLVQWLHDNDL
jgi:pimeloyl-ACP methyl ester carboxylesterase